MSNDEEATLTVAKLNIAKCIKLLDSGPGGRAQLRKIYKDELKRIEKLLKYHPRERDLAKT